MAAGVSIVIIDDSPGILELLSEALQSVAEIQVTGDAGTVTR
jgi:DNA-binding NarL/FixJ family response regulator